MRPERSRQERTGREDRHSKFYEISDNLTHGHPFFTASQALWECFSRYMLVHPTRNGTDHVFYVDRTPVVAVRRD